MQIIGNALNGHPFGELLRRADCEMLESIRVAVAYTTKPDPLIDLAKKHRVTLRLYTLFDGDRFPPRPVLERFIRQTSPAIQLFVTRDFFHPKIYWFEGVGAYIGSANLTDQGWNSNLECGVWFDVEDIEANNLEPELERMFAVVAGRCTPAAPAHLKLLDDIKHDRVGLVEQRKKFEAAAQKALDSLPGGGSPLDPTKGGELMERFINDWEATLTDLHKIVEFARTRPRPDWVSPSTHLAFIQDQATEHWYHFNVRTVGQDQIEILHRRNRARIDAALDEVFSTWANVEFTEPLALWTNESPVLLREILSTDRLRALGIEEMLVLVENSHAMRETARHLRKSTLGLPQVEEVSMEARYRGFAELLARTRNGAGRELGDVLEYVIWGDARTPRCAERVWNAIHDSAWRFPYLGEHTLNELIGYARPDDFPPRNNRVRKTLRALGFDHG